MRGRPAITEQGIVLRRLDYGESDLVLTIITAEAGRRGLFVRGGRKSKRRFAGSLEPLRLIEATFREGDAGSLCPLQDANLIESFDNISRELHALCWVSLALEWVERASPEGEPSELFATTLSLMRWLDKERRGPWYVEAGCLRFGLVLVASSGHAPTFDHCVRTGRSADEIAMPHFLLDGGVVDPQALRPDDVAVPVSHDTLRFLGALCTGHFPADRQFDTLRAARTLVLRLVHDIIEGEPKALSLLRTLWL